MSIVLSVFRSIEEKIDLEVSLSMLLVCINGLIGSEVSGFRHCAAGAALRSEDVRVMKSQKLLQGSLDKQHVTGISPFISQPFLHETRLTTSSTFCNTGDFIQASPGRQMSRCKKA